MAELTQAAWSEGAGQADPVAVVIDELAYLADADPDLLMVLQHWWDDNKRRPNLKIFLQCGRMPAWKKVRKRTRFQGIVSFQRTTP